MLSPLAGLPKKVVTLSLTLLMLLALAVPAHAGHYKEGTIGCSGSYKLHSKSFSSVSTTHYHWREGRYTAVDYNTTWLGWYWGTDTIYRGWSITASNLYHSSSYFYCRIP